MTCFIFADDKHKNYHKKKKIVAVCNSKSSSSQQKLCFGTKKKKKQEIKINWTFTFHPLTSNQQPTLQTLSENVVCSKKQKKHRQKEEED